MFTVVLSTLALEGLTLFLWYKDRNRMLNAVLARNPQEFKRLQEKPKPIDRSKELVNAAEVEFGL